MEDIIVYDKAKWHSSGNYPQGLPETQSFVHTGLYLGWIIDSGLHSEEFAEDNAELIAAFRERQCAPCDAYEVNDGCLADDMLNQSGNAFTQSYFDFSSGRFLGDYEKTLAKGLPSFYLGLTQLVLREWLASVNTTE